MHTTNLLCLMERVEPVGSINVSDPQPSKFAMFAAISGVFIGVGKPGE